MNRKFYFTNSELFICHHFLSEEIIPFSFNFDNSNTRLKYFLSALNRCVREWWTDFERNVSDSKSHVYGCWTPPVDFLSSVSVSLSRHTSPNGAAGDSKLPADGTIISLWGTAQTESLSAYIVPLLMWNESSPLGDTLHHGN